jgi:hypothetical protein
LLARHPVAPAPSGARPVESDRPADRARVMAWPLKRWHWRGAADMQATSRILTTGRSRWVGKPRIPALSSRRPAPGRRVASGLPTIPGPAGNPFDPTRQLLRHSHAGGLQRPRRSLSRCANSSPNASCQATPKATARRRTHHRARVLTIARRRQDTLADRRPRLRALFWNRCWEPALVVSRTASVSSIARR